MEATRLILLAASCAALLVPAAARAKSPPDMLVVAKNLDDIVSLDPAQAYELTSDEIAANLYDRLVEYHPGDPARLDPALAESWVAAADGKTITFTLRADARFTSGNPVRPEDVAFSLRRVVRLNKAPAALLTQLGWTAQNVDSMVRVASDRTVVLTIGTDVSPSFVLNLLAVHTCSIVDERVVAANARGGDLGNGWLSRHSAGSGPFSLRLWQPNEAVILDANPDHFGPVPKMRQIVLDHVAEPSTQRLMIQTGDVDIAYNLAPDQIAALKNNAEIRVETYPQAALHFFSLNLKVEKLRNQALWQAMRYLVDYDGIANTLLLGGMKVHQSFWPSGFPGAVDDTPYRLDIPRAKTILAAGGVPPGLTIDLDMIVSSPFIEIAQSLQATMAQAGITLNLLPGTSAQVITKYRARAHEMMLLYWSPDFMDPHSNAQAFAYNIDNADAAAQSTTAWRNAWLIPRLSAETQQALVEPDAARRLDLYRDLQRQVMAEAPWVMTFQAQKQVALRREVRGFVHGPVPDLIRYDQVSKE